MLDKAVSLGLSGNEVSKQVNGTSEVSAKRPPMVIVGAGALVTTGRPVAVPPAVASEIVSFIASRFR